MRLLLALTVVAGVVAGGLFLVPLLDPSGRSTVVSDWRGPSARDAPEVAALTRAARRIENDYPSVYCLLVAQHGRLLLERYYDGFEASSEFDLFSITKSVTSALVGIALADRRIKSLDQRVASFLPRKLSRASDPRLRKITLRDLLTMRAGYAGDLDPRGIVGDVPDYVRAVLNRPLVHDPGTTFTYDTGSSYLLSAVITHTTRMSAAQYARRRLFTALGVEQVDWSNGINHVSPGGSGLSLRARDVAKFGQLYLRRGRWAGRQLVPSAWVDRSTRPVTRFGPGRGYGYGWWTRTAQRLRTYAALGFGGQVLAVVPKLDLVVVYFSNPIGAEPDLHRILFDIITPAARTSYP